MQLLVKGALENKIQVLGGQSLFLMIETLVGRHWFLACDTPCYAHSQIASL